VIDNPALFDLTTHYRSLVQEMRAEVSERLETLVDWLPPHGQRRLLAIVRG